MTSNGLTSPRSGSLVMLTLTYLPQITEKLEKIDEETLRKLDEQIMKYVDKRNQLRKPILEDLEQQTLTIDNLNIANLNILHNESQCALLNLEREFEEFEKIKQSIQETNNRALREFIVPNSSEENGQ